MADYGKDFDQREMYVSVADFQAAGCLMSNDELLRRRVEVSTNLKLITIKASEKSYCMRLRKLQKDRIKEVRRGKLDLSKGTVFRDYEGIHRFTWVKRAPQGNVSFFRWLNPEKQTDKEPTPAETKLHDEGKEKIKCLILRNKLKVILECKSGLHNSKVHFLPGMGFGDPCSCATNTPWLPEEYKKTCTKAFAINGAGADFKVELEYHWTTSDGAVFKLDVAVLQWVSEDGSADSHWKLVSAVEVQASHADRKAKHAAFDKFGITYAQICARQIRDKCENLDLDTCRNNVIFDHHPVSAQVEWVCERCDNILKAKVAESKKKEDKFQEDLEARELEEAPYMTSYKAMAPNKYIKGFLKSVNLTKKQMIPGHTVLDLYDSQRKRRINNHPRKVRICVPEAILTVANEKGVVDGSQVCVQLGGKHTSGHSLVRGEIIEGYHLPLDDIRAAEPVPEEPAEPPEPVSADTPEPPEPMSVEPAEPLEPMSVEPAEPLEPMSVEPAEPLEPMSVEPVEPPEPVSVEPTEPAKQRKRKPETELDFRDAQFSDRNLERLSRTLMGYELSNRHRDASTVCSESDGKLDALERELKNPPV